MNKRRIVFDNCKSVNISGNAMDEFQQKNSKKRTFTENTWYDWYGCLINYTSELIKKTVNGVNDQIKNLLKPKIIVK